MSEKKLPSSADVVIVGAGVAGLYCAYRLLKEDPKRRVVLFDLLNRVGGRLDTDLVRIRDLDGKLVAVKDEEGGMRFNQSMTELLALLHELGMDGDIVPFGMGSDDNYDHITAITIDIVIVIDVDNVHASSGQAWRGIWSVWIAESRQYMLYELGLAMSLE